MPDQPSSTDPLAAFGPNEWLVDELYQQYLQDKESVDKAWWEFFEDYQPGDPRHQRRHGRGTVRAPRRPPRRATSARPARRRPSPPRSPPPRRRPSPPRRRPPRAAPPTAARPSQPATAAPAKPAAKAPSRRPASPEGQQGGDTPTPITREAPAKKSHRPGQRGRGQAAARRVGPRRHQHGVQPPGPDRDQRAGRAGQAADRQPRRHQQPPGPLAAAARSASPTSSATPSSRRWPRCRR